MREHLDKVIKADECAQYVDDIGIAANDAEHIINNLRGTFQCIRKATCNPTMKLIFRRMTFILLRALQNLENF